MNAKDVNLGSYFMLQFLDAYDDTVSKVHLSVSGSESGEVTFTLDGRQPNGNTSGIWECAWETSFKMSLAQAKAFHHWLGYAIESTGHRLGNPAAAPQEKPAE